MGLLASGAAHELGTPLSPLSVLIGDWKKEPDIARHGELQAALADMEAAVQSCKTIVRGISMSAGEAPGEAPRPPTLRAFLTPTLEERRAVRRPRSDERRVGEREGRQWE